jgi:hypothetical protein
MLPPSNCRCNDEYALSGAKTLFRHQEVHGCLSPEYQAGVRVTLVRERLLADISYSAAAAGGAPGAFTIGVAWTPPPWRPRDGPQAR